MSDPRADVTLEGIGARLVTIKHDSSIVYDATKANGSDQVGLAFTYTAAKTAGLVGDGEKVEGKIIQVHDDGMCTVQDEGYTELPGGNGATLTLGSAIVGDLDASANKGYVRSAAAPSAAYSQTEAQEALAARGSIIDPTTTTAVVVKL